MTVPGESHPSFELQSHMEELVTSGALAGRWYLLYWYPKASTPGCTAQAEGLRDQHEVFEELGCTVLGASFDQPEENRAFAERYTLPFALLSDVGGSVAAAVGAAAEGDSYPARVAHLVDPEGLVRQRYVVEDPEFFAEQVLDDLEALTGPVQP